MILQVVLASAIESVMERQIVPGCTRRIAARRRLAPEFLHSGEFGFVLRRHAASTQLRTQALKMAHHFVHLRELRQGHRRGEHALVRAILRRVPEVTRRFRTSLIGVRDTPNRTASSRSSRRRFPGFRPLTMSCSMAAMISDCVEAAFSGTRGERLWVRAADEAFIEGTELTREDEGTLVRLCAPAGQT